MEAELRGYYKADDPSVPSLGAELKDYLHNNLYFLFCAPCVPLLSLLGNEKARAAARTAKLKSKAGIRVKKTVRDARKVENEHNFASKRDCLNRYGFTLVPHKTAMKDADFVGNPMAATYTNVYEPEMRKLLEQLYPDAKEIKYFGSVIHGESILPQAHGIHQDFPITVEDMAWGHPSVKQRFDQADCKGVMVINLWRPIRTTDPIKDAPLAVLDPNTVVAKDMIPVVLFMPGGNTKQMTLRESPDHTWYYYPDMTCDEVLVFKTFEYFKGQGEEELRTCFHTAFNDPTAPPDCKKRVASATRFQLYF